MTSRPAELARPSAGRLDAGERDTTVVPAADDSAGVTLTADPVDAPGPAPAAGPPVDRRLLGVRGVRTHLVVATLCGAALTGLILLQAWLVARTVSGATDGAALSTLAPLVASVAGVALVRAALSYGAETAALRSAARAKSRLRRRLVAHLTSGPPDAAGRNAGELVTLATRGLDALDDYFARYLPQLVLAVLVPVAVLVVIADADWVSAVVIAGTLPLIPLFMALVGMHTRARTERQWQLLSRLGGHFLDVVQGLPTLALFRRAQAVAGKVRETTGEHRRATMGTLRVAFLSAFVLEVLATLAVALVAVEVGLRLLYGDLDLETALLVLILAPEAYLPLREVGARFHASTEGVAAARNVFAVIDDGPAGAGAPARAPTAARPSVTSASARQQPGGPRPPNPGTGVAFDGVAVRYPGAGRRAVRDARLDVAAGESVLVRGPSGAGKSTLLAVLLRFVEIESGIVRVAGPATGDPGRDGTDLRDLDPDAWRATLAWVPQRPHLFAGSVADNVRLGEPDAPMAAVREAARRAGLDAVVAGLPRGYDTPLGENGARLSSGERQRVALARAFLRDAPLVLLDEPTAHLDPDSAAAVRSSAAELLRGRTALVVAHDEGWAELVDRVVTMRDGVLDAAPAATGDPATTAPIPGAAAGVPR